MAPVLYSLQRLQFISPTSQNLLKNHSLLMKNTNLVFVSMSSRRVGHSVVDNCFPGTKAYFFRPADFMALSNRDMDIPSPFVSSSVMT